MVNRNWRFVPILLVIIWTLWSRMDRVLNLGYFMIDEERDAFLVKRLLVDHRPLLVGGVIPGGINVGPFFFYLSAIPYFISNLNPIGPAYFAGLIGVIGVIGIYLVGRKMFGNRVGFLAMIFSAFSALNIIYQRPWWPLTPSQLVTLGVYFSLWNIIKNNSKKWLWILVGCLIIGAQSDPSTLSLIPLSMILLWWKRKTIGLGNIDFFKAIGVFLLAHVTWLIFEFRHNFLSTRAIIGLFQGPSLLSKDGPLGGGPMEVLRMTAGLLYRLFFITGSLDVTKQINTYEGFVKDRIDGIWWPAAALLLFIVGHWMVTSLRGKNLARKIISLHFLISLGGILLYTTLFPGYVHEWLWQFMFPAFFLIFADILVNLSYKVSASWRTCMRRVGPLLVLIWVIWQTSLFLKLENVAGLGNKLQLVKEAQSEIAGRPYELRSEGSPAFRYGGWRYLFELNGNPPVESYMDYVFANWVYPIIIREPEIVVRAINLEDNSPTYEIEKL